MEEFYKQMEEFYKQLEEEVNNQILERLPQETAEIALNMSFQCKRVILFMDICGSITALEACKKIGVMRLASRIHDIRKEGIKVFEKSDSAMNRYGEKTTFSRYSLKEFCND